MVADGLDVAIVGVGETTPVRRSGQSPRDMVLDAVTLAMNDAGLELGQVDAVVTEGGLMERALPAADIAHLIRAPESAPCIQLSVGAAGIVGSPVLAASLIRSGLASTVLCYFAADWGTNPTGPGALHTSDPIKSALEMPYGFSGQPAFFAAMARRYAHEYGLQESQLGDVAIAARGWAGLHPAALRREPLDHAGYFRSPMVADPLRQLDCCLLSDGAAAFVLTSTARARDRPHPVVQAAGCAFSRSPVSSHGFFTQNPSFLSGPARISGPRALAQAGIAGDDVDVALLYDCFTITVLMQLEDLGLCGRGEAASFVADGGIGPGGRLPVNTHGGLLSHAYLAGISHVVEAVRQVRGDCGARQVPDTEVALVSGYSGAEHATLVLTGG